MLTFDFVFRISQAFVEIWGGGGCMVDIIAHRLNVIACPYLILFHMIITGLLAVMNVSVVSYSCNERVCGQL